MAFRNALGDLVVALNAKAYLQKLDNPIAAVGVLTAFYDFLGKGITEQEVDKRAMGRLLPYPAVVGLEALMEDENEK